MKKALFTYFILLSICSFAQPKNYIGVRVGDFNSIDYKRKLSEHTSLEAMAGRSLFWGYDYEQKFYDYIKTTEYDVLVDNFVNDVKIEDKSSIGIGSRLLFDKEFKNIPRMFFYYGVGTQFVRVSHTFLFRYKETRNGSTRVNSVTEKYYTNLLGIDGIIGVEYSFEEVPINLFADISIFTELLDQPGSIMGQAGLGARYMF